MRSTDKKSSSQWKTRYTIVLMCFAAVFVIYIDRINISVAILPMAKQYDWDDKTQGLILSVVYVGYLLMQFYGGRFADRFGGKRVLSVGILVCTIFTILTPPAAMLGIGALVAARIGMGLGSAVTFPSAYSLVSRWFPNTERSRALAINATGVPTGTVFALVATPVIVEQFGWPWAFYLFGVVGGVWILAWTHLVTTHPREHPRISSHELDEIQRHTVAHGVVADPPSIFHLLKNMALWAIIVAHFCNNWTLYVILSWLPKYVNEELGVDFSAVGVVSMLPHITSIVFMNVFGNVSDRLLKRGVNVTVVRKLMQSIAFGGLAVCLFLVAGMTTVWAAIGILCLGRFFSAASFGGFNVNHMDIGPNYAGTLMGITNTAGTIPGIVGVYITGLILDATGSWSLVFQVTGGVALFGMTFYLIFASGQKQFN